MQRRLRTTAIIFLLLLLLAAPLMADNAARYQKLGHHNLICTCGCNQILLECNHVGCTVSGTEIKELNTALDRGDADDLILQGFVQKYGPTVLAAPTTTGFNLVAWITPVVIVGLGFLGAVFLVRNWKLRPATAPAPSGNRTTDQYRDRVREETEL